MDSLEKVILTSENSISTITLNRPENYNALDVETLEKLLLFIKEVEHNNDRILMLTGAGKAFCSGGDISLMSQVTSTEQLESLMDIISEIATKLYMLPKIVVTAVNGFAVGLGLSLAMASDYIVANEEARFGMLFAGIGLIPDGGGHFFLQERLGVHQTKQFIWNSEQIKAKQAQKVGLVDLITESKAEEAAQELAQKILMSPFKAIIRSKLILHESKQADLAAYLSAEKEGQAEVSKTKDHQEGITAFVEKRRPLFKGE